MFLTKLQTSQDKLVKYLEELKTGKVLFLFDHGLGDYVMFLNIFDKLIKKYPNIKFFLGYNKKFNYQGLHTNMFEVSNKKELNFNQIYFTGKIEDKYDIPKLETEFDIVVDLIFPESPMKLNKMLVCATQEIGFNECPAAGSYKLYNGPVASVENNNIVGIHCVTNSGVKQKSLTMDECKQLWCNLKEFGYSPLLFHTQFKASSPEYLQYKFDWVEPHIIKSNTIEGMMENIAKCKFFIGVVSGPACIAHNILGEKRCASILKANRPITDFLYKSNIPTIRTTRKDQIAKVLKIMEDNEDNILNIDNKLKKFPAEAHINPEEYSEYEIVHNIVDKHPSLEGLQGRERINMLREINRRGLSAPIETKFIKKTYS